MRRRLRALEILIAGTALSLAGCNSDSSGPGNGGSQLGEVIVLNSLGRTIQRFDVNGQTLVEVGQPITLPANFDGASMDIFADLWVTTISAAGGSQVVFGSFITGEQAVTEFPGAEGALADPSRPSLVQYITGDIAAVVAGRGTDAVYLAFPGQTTAITLAGDAGEFIERVVLAGQILVTIDANLDDDGLTYEPLGDPRVGMYQFDDGTFFDEVTLAGASNATDALIFEDDVLVLAGGSFGPAPDFAPQGDGQAIVVDATAREVTRTLDLEGNGIALEGGRNGLGYITRTTGADFSATDLLTYNFSTRTFDRGPSNPIRPREADGSALGCWAASALRDSRVLCITFDVAQDGRLVLMDPDGAYLDEVPVGRGATDIAVR